MATLRLLIVVQQQGAQATTTALTNVGTRARTASRGVGLLNTALLGLGAGAAIRGLVNAADSFTKVENRVRLTTSGTQEFSKSMKDVFNIAQETRQPLEATAILYSRLAVNTRDLGFSQQRLVGLVTDINKAVAVSGSTAQEARNGLIQLSQGFASGQLRGEEFRAVAEQLPFLLITIADGLGKPIGELRKLAFEGKLTPEIVAKAIESQSARIAAAFKTMTPTIEQAGTIIRNAFEQFVGQLNNAAGASVTFGGLARAAAANITLIASAVAAVTVVLGVYTIAARIAAASTRSLFIATGVGTLIVAITLLIDAVVTFGLSTTKIQGESITGFQRMGIAIQAFGAAFGQLVSPIGRFFSFLVEGASKAEQSNDDLRVSYVGVPKAVGEAFSTALNLIKAFVNAAFGLIAGLISGTVTAFKVLPKRLSGALSVDEALKAIKDSFTTAANTDFVGAAFEGGTAAIDTFQAHLKSVTEAYDGAYKAAQDAAIARTKAEREENDKLAQQLRELEASLKGAGADSSLVAGGSKSEIAKAESAAKRLKALEDSLTVARTKQIEPLVAQIQKLQIQQVLAANLAKASGGRATADKAIAAAQAQIVGIQEKIAAASTTNENLAARTAVAIERIRLVSPLYADDLERAAVAALATEGGFAKVSAALKPVANEAADAAAAIDAELLRSSEAFASQLSSSLVSGIRSAAQGEGFDVLALLADQFAAALEESIAGILTDLTLQAKKLFEGLTAPNGALAGLGPTLGKAIGAAVGVAGLALDLFSRDSGSNVTNNLVKSAVESTQTTRGVVAGPTSIPIFQLGEELEGANLGVIAAIDRVAAILLGQTPSGQPLSLDDQAGTLLGSTSSSLF